MTTTRNNPPDDWNLTGRVQFDDETLEALRSDDLPPVTFDLKIHTADDAIASDPVHGIADRLRMIADRLEAEGRSRANGHTASILDVNGNRIGSFRLVVGDVTE